ncbi:Ubiquitin-related domain,Rad60/SUMO-like domain,Ubiquitin domain [Cinara cedri]|uniref:Ubiquitin-related domain,Rad60/SUMO-like domain,Ubiquitin domain n=1 Tax=Cinara cedri TaxID=506608 RepID=A0A5E4N6M0_9HEMI|nr:Ubiquitin-related domain,Rad60/SUMO-like domain,Ubiquitin domain [Cinara cedri]
MSSDEEAHLKPSTSQTNVPAHKEPNEQGAAAQEVGEASTSALQVFEEKTPVDEYIRLRIITSDMTNEVHFRVKAGTALGRLKRSYSNRLGFQQDELRFVFDGHRIHDDDTPKSLNMLNDDVIEIYQERTGGM